MENLFDIILTIVVLGFWIIFPIGMFLSVSHVDKNTDQIVRLDKLKHFSEEPVLGKERQREEKYRSVPFDWHHPLHFFRRWLQQEG